MRNHCLLGLILSLPILSLSSPSFPEGAMIVQVIDVDRFLLTSGEEVECLGIYIPLLGKKFREEVIPEVQKMVNEKSLKLEFDSTQRAPFGKLRAYIFADGIFVNAELVKRGYALLLPSSEKLKYGSYLVELENQAKAEKRGFWNESYWMTEYCSCY